jgi:lysozyme
MPQFPSAACLALIERFEGCKLRIYPDTGGLPTIGWGHRIVPGENFSGGIDQTRADSLLAGDAATAAHQVSELIKVPLTQGQFDALVDFIFNLGAGRLAASTLLKDLNDGEYSAAADQIKLWDHGMEDGRKIELADLKVRRAAEFALWHS